MLMAGMLENSPSEEKRARRTKAQKEFPTMFPQPCSNAHVSDSRPKRRLHRPSVAVVTALMLCATLSGAQQIPALDGLNFGPYIAGQNPNTNPAPQITVAQIRGRLQIVAPYTTWIRTFGSTNGLEAIPAVARSFGLKVAAGAWIG